MESNKSHMKRPVSFAAARLALLAVLWSLLLTLVVTSGALAAAWDFNGDLKSDVLWRHTTGGEIAIWRVDGTTLLQTGAIEQTSAPDWSIVGVADFNNDNK